MPYKDLEKQREYWKSNREKIKEYSRKYNKAHPEKCRERDRKWREANPERVRERNRKYNKAHPEKSISKVKRYRKAHPEKVREWNKRYLKAHPEKVREKNRKWHKANPEKVRERDRKYRKDHPKKIKEIYKKYYKAHPMKCRLKCIKRRENLSKVIRSYTLQEWKNKLNEANGVCPGYENTPHFVGIDKLTLDHIIAISKAPVGFVYTINDIRPLCQSCNSRKCNKLTEEIRGEIQAQLEVGA